MSTRGLPSPSRPRGRLCSYTMISKPRTTPHKTAGEHPIHRPPTLPVIRAYPCWEVAFGPSRAFGVLVRGLLPGEGAVEETSKPMYWVGWFQAGVLGTIGWPEQDVAQGVGERVQPQPPVQIWAREEFWIVLL